MTKQSLLRIPGHNDHKVSFVELFFDLVFVFTIIQLSHTLSHHFSVSGFLETLLLGIAVWWIWIYTTWVTNWLDPDKSSVRNMLFFLMFLGLLMSTSIPDAFGERGWLFASAYVAIQLCRSAYMLYALKGTDTQNYRNFIRITVWLAVSSPLWIAGAFFQHEQRLLIWTLALTLEFISPALGFRVPGLGHSSEKDWKVSGEHMAERCALFIIICLGETILVMGGNFTEIAPSPINLIAFAVTFMTTISFWWLYFRFGHERAAPLIAKSSNPGGLARWAYTYAHTPIVIGILLTAVAADFTLSRSQQIATMATTAAIIGGPMIFLAGNLLFKTITTRRPPLSHLFGLVTLGLLALPAGISNLILAALCALVLLITATWEWRSLSR